MNIKNGKQIYGVEQSVHGHLYRWIFTEAGLLNQNVEPFSGETRDIFFPIGGSNSSATYMVELNTEEEIRSFLMAEYETDYEDPMLVDIAEGIFTIDTQDEYHGSITSKYVKLFGIPEDELTKENSLMTKAQSLIIAIKEYDTDENSGLDHENPFYRDSKDMRLSELEDILEQLENKETTKEEQLRGDFCELTSIKEGKQCKI